MTRSLLVDTNVWGAQVNPLGEVLWYPFARHLVDARPAITMHTIADLRFGALDAGWGPRRMAKLERS